MRKCIICETRPTLGTALTDIKPYSLGKGWASSAVTAVAAAALTGLLFATPVTFDYSTLTLAPKATLANMHEEEPPPEEREEPPPGEREEMPPPEGREEMPEPPEGAEPPAPEDAPGAEPPEGVEMPEGFEPLDGAGPP